MTPLDDHDLLHAGWPDLRRDAPWPGTPLATRRRDEGPAHQFGLESRAALEGAGGLTIGTYGVADSVGRGVSGM